MKTEEKLEFNPDEYPSLANLKKLMIIFDFDDTLIPTTNGLCYNAKTKEVVVNDNYGAKDWNQLGFKLIKLFQTISVAVGTENVYIVSNGTHWWIQSATESIYKFVNNCLDLKINDSNNAWKILMDKWLSFGIVKTSLIINDSKIPFYSAASWNNNASRFPNKPILWKEKMFDYLYYSSYYSNIDKNIYSIGDGEAEFIASNKVATQAGVKIIRKKLVKKPSMQMIMSQIENIIDYFGDMNTSKAF